MIPFLNAANQATFFDTIFATFRIIRKKIFYFKEEKKQEKKSEKERLFDQNFSKSEKIQKIQNDPNHAKWVTKLITGQ